MIYLTKAFNYYFVFNTVIILTLLSPWAIAVSQPGPQKNKDGWTILSPSVDSRIIYVSSSLGNDKTGEVYNLVEIGNKPKEPIDLARIKPFKTFKAAYTHTRKNNADWILIKRGDNFYENITVKNGKSATEPYVISTYGKSKSNPTFNTGTKRAMSLCCHSLSNIIIQGLSFYAHTRNPNTKDYISSDGSVGFSIYINEGQELNNVLIEGNTFRFYTGNTIQGKGTFHNFVLRRNLLLDSYSTTGHSAGLYAHNVSLILEENIFDHNGWLKQANKEFGVAASQGAATMFNHNTYFSDSKKVRFLNNIFIRSSSMHNKWTANKGEHSSGDVVIKNNLYIDGEIGISAGGNKLGDYRFKDYVITDNVMLNIGKSMPTNRGLSWGIEVKDWDSGVIKNNYFLNQTSNEIRNTYGIHVSNSAKDIDIINNHFQNLTNGYALVFDNIHKKENISINENLFNLNENSREIIKFKGVHSDLSNYKFNNNKYFHQSGKNKTLRLIDNSKKPFWSNILSVKKDDSSFSYWTSLTNEDNPQWINTASKTPRTIESYLHSIGKEATMASFIHEIRQMSMTNWDDRFTAETINKYIKAGYN